MAIPLRLICACGLMLACGACVESEQPLSDAAQAEQDPRLYGLWLDTNNTGSTAYILIGDEGSEPLEPGRADVERGLMRYWSISQNSETKQLDEPAGTRFFCTQIGDENFATWVTPVEEGQNKRPTYFFVKYQVDDQQLTIWIQDPESTAQAIDSGKLRGIVKRRDKPGASQPEIETLKITDSSENIRKFLAEGGSATCFPDKNKVVYSKIR